MADYVNPLAAFQQGVNTVKGLQGDDARRRSGAILATGNYSAAANPLLEAGLLDEGTAVQDQGRQMAAARAKQSADQEKAVVDYTGQVLGSLGNVWSQYSAQDQDPTKRNAKAKVIQAFDMHTSHLKSLGESDEEIGQLRSQFEQDPELTLRALGAAIEQRKLEYRTAGDETVVLDGSKVVNRIRHARTTGVPEGGALYEIPGTGGMEAPAAPASIGAPQAAPVPQSAPLAGGTPTGSRAARNNNPGNLRSSGDQWQGMTGTDPQGFVMFDTPENGQRAAAINLANQQKLHGINTLQDLVAKYAPASDNNDVGAYVATLARQTGFAPDQPLDLTDPAVQAKILPAMFQVEGGGTPSPAPRAAQPGPIAAPQASQPAPAAPQDQPEGPRLLVQRPKAPQQVRTLSPAEVEAAGFLPGTIVQQKPDGSFNTVQSPNNQASPRKAEADLRKEFNARPEVKEYREVSNSYRTINDLFSKPPSAASDIASIFSYMKMLDPGSVVREGEFATAQNAAGIPDQVRNLYNKAKDGQRLNPKQRADFLAQAKSIYETRSTRFKDLADEYRGYATDYGVDPGRVVTAPAAPAPAQTRPTRPAAPKRGEVRGGWRYNGGPPADQSSWSKVKP